MNFRLFAIALAVACCAGCSEKRSHAVSESAQTKGVEGATQDYRQMLERSRARQRSKDSLLAMQDAVQRFQRDIGRLPTNLVEILNRNYIKSFPELPAGRQFSYNAEQGIVEIITVKTDTLTPMLPPEPALTNRPTLSPVPRS